jgi:hypothetical protein
MHLLTGRLLCFSNYLFFNGPKPPRRNKEQKGQQSSVGARPCPCPEGRLHGLCLSFLLLHSFGGKGVDIRLPYLRGFCIPSKQYILYQTYPKQLYPFFFFFLFTCSVRASLRSLRLFPTAHWTSCKPRSR